MESPDASSPDPNEIKKAYIILHDDNNLLVCSGGEVGRGKKKKIRTGCHLPGGTMENNETPLNAALRELKEETGIVVDPNHIVSVEFSINKQGSKWSKELNKAIDVTYQLNFIVAKHTNKSVQDLIEARKSELTKKNPFDMPFTIFTPLSIETCLNNDGFDCKHGTDWFSEGIKHARKNGGFSKVWK